MDSDFKYQQGFFRNIFETSNEALLVLEGDIVIRCNKKLIDYFRYQSEEEILGLTPWDLSPEYQEDGKRSKEKAVEMLTNSTTKGKEIFEWLHKTKDGENLYTEVALSRFDYQDKTFVLASIRDISERKDMMRQLIKVKEKAEKSTKLKTNFLANMAHDIRNPLNAILGFSRMLAEDTNISTEDRRRFGSLIESNGSNLLYLINDIIDVSKIEANQMQINNRKMELNSVLEELYLSFQKQVKDIDSLTLKLNIAIDDPDFTIFSDADRIRQILSNLLSNAIKYTKKGLIEFGYTISDDQKMIQFFVKDTGIGIEAEHLEGIFERFTREEKGEVKKIQGTGLGLDISRRLVELLGGEIWANSELNKGSDFFFTIPAHLLNYNPKYQKPKSPQIGGVDAVDWSKYHILIADDDAINFELLRIILSKTKVRISKAINGKEAIDLLETDKSIDLMLLDIQMPVMNGYEAIKHIRRINPKMPVIAQTAVSLEYGSDTGSNEMFDDCISKPIDVKSLISKVGQYLAKL